MIEIKGLNHHLLCSMQCYINGVVIEKASKFLVPISSETMHSIELENPFDANHPIIIPLKLHGVTSYFEVRTSNQEKDEDPNILRIKYMAEAPPWDPSNLEFRWQEQSMLDYRGWLFSPITPYLSTLLNHMHMMLQMLWMPTTMLLCWRVLLTNHHYK